jgi:hypothetical protein
MISGLSESLTLTLVLLLVFGSVCLYLYTRITQTEQKISLIESILLDLKMASDLRSFDAGADDDGQNFSEVTAGVPAVAAVKSTVHSSEEQEYDEYKAYIDSARAVRTDNLAPVDLDGVDDIAEISPAVATTVAAGSPASVSSPTTTEVTAEVTTDAVSSVTGAAPFEAEDVPFESLGSIGTTQTAVQPNLEAMTAKELHTLAKQRGIVGESKMTRSQLIQELTAN